MMHRTRRFRIDKRYLLIPQVKSPYVSTYTSDLPFSGWQKTEATHELTVKIGGRTLLAQHMAFGRKRPWWWAGLDVSRWHGSTMEISGSFLPEGEEAFDAICLSANLGLLPGLYRESNRPQFHFSYRHGALGDPTAMVYYAPRQEWHLFTIHNPFRGLEICWGHAVSKDLLHWQERPPLFHHPHGIFNGVGFTDTNNRLGLNSDGEQAMVLLTPIMCNEYGTILMTVSVDGGETFHDITELKHDLGRDNLPGGAIVPGWGDAPRLYWNPVARQFFLTHCRWSYEEGRSVESLQYTSTDLLKWKRIENFPLLVFDNWHHSGDANDVLELPLDGNEENRIVLIMCGLEGYALGRYAKTGIDNLAGAPLSSSDVIVDQHAGYPVIFTGAPGGRGIIMYNVGNDGAGGIVNHEAAYSPNLSFPLELSLRSTRAGPRLYQNPVAEIERLYGKRHTLGNFQIGNVALSVEGPEGGLYRMQAVIEAGTAEEIDVVVMGYTVTYNVKSGTVGGSSAERKGEVSQQGDAIKIDMLVDRTSIELFPNDGELFIFYGRLKLYEHKGPHFTFNTRGGEARVRDLRVIEIKSIW